MSVNSLAGRAFLAKRILTMRDALAEKVCGRLFEQHPEWREGCGEGGISTCREDISLHLEFLAGAIESGSPAAFGHYREWARRVLRARGLSDDSLSGMLAAIGDNLGEALSEEEGSLVDSYLHGDLTGIPQPLQVAQLKSALELGREVFLSALLNGQRKGALAIVEQALREGIALREIYIEIFTDSLRRVGELWESNRITVAQEHLATTIVQYAIAGVYPRIVRQEPCRGSMVVTGVAGELHQVGANIVADVMEAEGWDVRFLGTNLPERDILEAVKLASAEVLCVSTTLVANLPAASRLIRKIRKQMGASAPRIVVGGAAFRWAVGFADDLGAHSCGADLRTGLKLLCG